MLEKAVGEGEDFDMAVQKLLTEIITEHGAVVFNGDGYSENWQIEAAERGLPNLKTTLDAIPELVKPEAIEVFEKYGVFNERELHSREEVRYEMYALTVGVEAKLTLEMGSTVILPAAIRYQTELACNVATLKAAGSSRTPTLLEAVSTPISELTGGAGGAQDGAGRARRRLRCRGGQALRRACCRRWTRCVPPPTRWKALWPTTCGRCRPTRRCCTSSEIGRQSPASRLAHGCVLRVRMLYTLRCMMVLCRARISTSMTSWSQLPSACTGLIPSAARLTSHYAGSSARR